MREIKFRAWDGKEILDVPVNHSGYTLNELLDGISANYKLMQYTGLKDKNGVEIYGGDIIKADDSVETVNWDNDMAGFYPFVSQIPCAADSYSEWIYNSYEVIGNIYENKELLDE